MRILLLLLAALIVAGGTGYYTLRAFQAPAAPVPVAAVTAPRPTQIYVAASELTVGTIILPEQLGQMPVAKSAITPEMIVANEEGQALLVGSVARQVLAKGLPIARSAIVQPGDRGFLAAVLPRGKRAVSIPIGEVAGISGLVLPGDRVDIILTYSVTADLMGSKRDIHASETVVRNLRVLALDQRLGQSAAEGEKQARSVPIAQTATLEVTPDQAEMITLATTLGQLSLVLNSVRDGGEPEDVTNDAPPLLLEGPTRDTGGRLAAIRPRKMTLDSEVTTLLNRDNDARVEERVRAVAVQVVRGRTTSAVLYGGDPKPEPPPGTEAPAAAQH